MARIRILQGVAGADFSWVPGEVVDLDDEAAAAWADGHRAEYADDPPPPPAGDAPGPAGDTPAAAEGSSPFDPSTATVAQVLAYLDGAGEQEAVRVLDAEAAAPNPRRGIVSQRGAVLERERAAAAERDQAPPENAAQISRGGGRDPGIETR